MEISAPGVLACGAECGQGGQGCQQLLAWDSRTDQEKEHLCRLGSGQEDGGRLAAGVAVGGGKGGGLGAFSEEPSENQGLPTEPWRGAPLAVWTPAWEGGMDRCSFVTWVYAGS